MKKLIVLLCLPVALAISACSVNQTQLATQYATLKLLESDYVTKEAVLSRVDRVRLILQGDYVPIAAVYQALGWDRLQPSQRLLVSAIVRDVSSRDAGERINVERAITVLDWIEQAAAMSD